MNHIRQSIKFLRITRYHRCYLSDRMFQSCTTGKTKRFSENVSNQLRWHIQNVSSDFDKSNPPRSLQAFRFAVRLLIVDETKPSRSRILLRWKDWFVIYKSNHSKEIHMAKISRSVRNWHMNIQRLKETNFNSDGVKHKLPETYQKYQ